VPQDAVFPVASFNASFKGTIAASQAVGLESSQAMHAEGIGDMVAFIA
jgi:hypothetical protein